MYIFGDLPVISAVSVAVKCVKYVLSIKLSKVHYYTKCLISKGFQKYILYI